MGVSRCVHTCFVLSVCVLLIGALLYRAVPHETGWPGHPVYKPLKGHNKYLMYLPTGDALEQWHAFLVAMDIAHATGRKVVAMPLLDDLPPYMEHSTDCTETPRNGLHLQGYAKVVLRGVEASVDKPTWIRDYWNIGWEHTVEWTMVRDLRPVPAFDATHCVPVTLDTLKTRMRRYQNTTLVLLAAPLKIGLQTSEHYAELGNTSFTPWFRAYLDRFEATLPETFRCLELQVHRGLTGVALSKHLSPIIHSERVTAFINQTETVLVAGNFNLRRTDTLAHIHAPLVLEVPADLPLVAQRLVFAVVCREAEAIMRA